jgi:hypothetical protein
MSLCSPSSNDAPVSRPSHRAFLCREREHRHGPHFWPSEGCTVQTPVAGRTRWHGSGPRTPARGHGWAHGQPPCTPPHRRVQRDHAVRRPWWPKCLPWLHGLSGEVKASHPGGRLTTGDEDPTPALRIATVGERRAFHPTPGGQRECALCSRNPKRAASWDWAHPSPAGYKRPIREGRGRLGSFSGL